MSIRRSVFFSFVSKYAETLIFTISTVVLARILTPEDIGVFSVAAAVGGICAGLREFGLTNYIVQEKDLTRARLRSAFWIGLFISATAGCLVLLIAAPAGAFYSDDRVATVLEILAIGFFISPLTTPIIGRMRREMDYRSITKITLVVGLLQAGSMIVLAWHGFGPYALAWGTVINIAGSFAVAICLRPAMDWLGFELTEWRAVLHFGGYSTGLAIISEVNSNLSDLILGKFAGLGAVGLLSRAKGTVDLFNRLILDAIGQVTLPIMSQQMRDGSEPGQLYRTATRYLTGVSWPFYGTLVVACPDIILLLFGNQWVAAIVPAQILASGRAVTSLQVFVSPILLASGKIRSIVLVQMAVTLSNVSILLWTSSNGIEAVAIGTACINILGAALYLILLKYYVPNSLTGNIAALRASFVIGVVVTLTALVASTVVRALAVGPVLSILAVGATSSLVWMGSIFASHHPIAAEIRLLHSRLPYGGRRG